MIGATGFEPAISHSQSERDTKLRHAPISLLYSFMGLAVNDCTIPAAQQFPARPGSL